VRVGRNVMRSRNQMEPAALASRLVNGNPDPTPTPARSVFERALIGTLSEFNGTGTPTGSLTMAQVLVFENSAATGAPVTSSRFSSARIKRIEVWGSSTLESGDSALSITLPTSSAGDGATFRDFGTPGERRPHLAVVPNFDYRDTWYSSSNILSLFQLTPATDTSMIIRLTLELR